MSPSPLSTITVSSRFEALIATADGNDVVIQTGLQPGMEVVTAGVHVLSPGQKVTVYQEKLAPAVAKSAASAASAAK